MSELDKVLLQLQENRSSNLSAKNRIKFSEDLHIKKVAFDMYKVLRDQYDDLWKVEEVEGERFLVRSSEPKFSQKDEGNWVVTGNYDCDSVTLSYKNVPICSFTSEEFGFDSNDIFTFKSALLDVIETDEGFVKKVLEKQPKAKVSAIRNLFPELIK